MKGKGKGRGKKAKAVKEEPSDEENQDQNSDWIAPWWTPDETQIEELAEDLAKAQTEAKSCNLVIYDESPNTRKSKMSKKDIKKNQLILKIILHRLNGRALKPTTKT